MNTASLCIPQCTQRNMYISRATNARLPLPPHFSPRFSSCHHFRDHIVWTPAYCHSPPPLYSSISSIRSSPSREASGVTWIALMVPAIGELTTVSIFMAERTHSGWPFSTCKKCKHSSIKKCQMYRSMNKTSWFKFGCLCLMKLWNLDSTTAMSEVFSLVRTRLFWRCLRFSVHYFQALCSPMCPSLALNTFVLFVIYSHCLAIYLQKRISLLRPKRQSLKKGLVLTQRDQIKYPNVRTLRAITKSRSTLIEMRDHMMREKL